MDQLPPGAHVIHLFDSEDATLRVRFDEPAALHSALLVLRDTDCDVLAEGPGPIEAEVPASARRLVAVGLTSDQPVPVWGDVAEAIRGELQHGGTWSGIRPTLGADFTLSERRLYRLQPEDIRRGGVVPLPSQGGGAWLQSAGKYARAGAFTESIRRHNKALRYARASGDIGTEVRASSTLAGLLEAEGYAADAEEVLVRLVERCALSSRWLLWLCANRARAATFQGRLREARRWVDLPTPAEVAEGSAEKGSIGRQFLTAAARLLFEEGHPVACLALLHEHEALLEQTRRGDWRLLRVHAALRAGGAAREQEQARWGRWSEQNADSLPALGLDLVRFCAERAAVHGAPYPLLQRVREVCASYDRRILPVKMRAPLRALIDEAAPELRATLWRHLWLHSIEVDSAIPLLFCVRGGAGRAGRWVLGRSDGDVVSVDLDEMQRLVADAIGELLRDQANGPRLCELGELLFPTAVRRVFAVPEGPLSTAPILAAHRAVHGNRLPALFHPVGVRRPYRSTTTTAFSIVSLADPHGDLPGARAEMRGRAHLELVGEEASWESLTDLDDAGLLVIGTHTDGGILNLADREVRAADLGGLLLTGRPVVILSGCGGAQQGPQLRALPDGFRRAGARSVLGYAWRINDAEARRATGTLLDLWRYLGDDPADWVARAVEQMIKRGVPPHIWGALRLY